MTKAFRLESSLEKEMSIDLSITYTSPTFKMAMNSASVTKLFGLQMKVSRSICLGE